MNNMNQRRTLRQDRMPMTSSARKRLYRAARFGASVMEALEDRLLLSASHHKEYQPYVRLSHNSPHQTSGPTGLTPQDVTQAYGMNLVTFGSIIGDGTGQTIAIVDAYNAPTIRGDLEAFDLQFGLPDPQLTIVNQN